MSGYLELHASEFLIIGGLFLGVAIGLWCGIALGKESVKPVVINEFRQPRDAKGRFVADER